jgi:uncharacterized protein
MDIKKINQIALEILSKRKAHVERERGFIYNHGKRVAALSLNLHSKIEGCDIALQDIIYAGALFHDVGKGIGKHGETGAILVRDLLKNCCTSYELENISAIVRLHNKRGQKELPDMIKIVQDADILDHMGTQEIWMSFLYSSYADKGPDSAIDFWKGDFFKSHISGARELLNFDISKAIYDERLNFELKFIERFIIESKGEIFNINAADNK